MYWMIDFKHQCLSEGNVNILDGMFRGSRKLLKRFPEVSAVRARPGGKRAETAAGHPVSRAVCRSHQQAARHPLARIRVQVHSRSITENISVVWRNRHDRPPRPARTPGPAIRPARSRATLAAERPQGSGLRTRRVARCGAPVPPMAPLARLRALRIGPQATRQWPRRPEFGARRASHRLRPDGLRASVRATFARRSPALAPTDCIARSADHFADFHS